VDALVKDAWRLYQRAEDAPYVVRPSIPIVYFGDRERYSRSPLKAITVALNPSRAEFPAGDPFARFRRAQDVYPDILHGRYYADYLAALNDYFRGQPYWRWFTAFEPLLNGMGCSYRDERLHAALHTDLCSPLATNPTWSRLTQERASLVADGRALWLRLARTLGPDVILISVAQHHLDQLDVPPLSTWESIYTLPRTHPYAVSAHEIEIGPGQRSLLVFGRAATTPFGLVTAEVKREIGRHIAERVQASMSS
jgi:hypothetical protein